MKAPYGDDRHYYQEEKKRRKRKKERERNKGRGMLVCLYYKVDRGGQVGTYYVSCIVCIILYNIIPKVLE